MKLRHSFITALLILSLSTVSWAAIEPFSKGEVINYNIKKFGIKMGDATLTFNGTVEVNGSDALSITFTAQGFQFFDQEEIYIDAKTFFPLLIKRNLNIFGKKETITEFYDPSEGKVRIVKRVNQKTTEQIIKNGSQFDNIYGFIYRQRQLSTLEQGKALNLHLPTQDLQFQFAKRGTFSVAGQEFDADQMESVPKKFQIWFDRSSRRIPLKIDGAIGFGGMSLVFNTIDGE